jgi:hypothetical protein
MKILRDILDTILVLIGLVAGLKYKEYGFFIGYATCLSSFLFMKLYNHFVLNQRS